MLQKVYFSVDRWLTIEWFSELKMMLLVEHKKHATCCDWLKLGIYSVGGSFIATAVSGCRSVCTKKPRQLTSNACVESRDSA